MASLHQFRCFLLSAYALGSLTAAADELGYSQPSISQQIRLLERSMGVDLFHRVGRGVVPTEAAEALRPHAERSLAAAQAAPWTDPAPTDPGAEGTHQHKSAQMNSPDRAYVSMSARLG